MIATYTTNTTISYSSTTTSNEIEFPSVEYTTDTGFATSSTSYSITIYVDESEEEDEEIEDPKSKWVLQKKIQKPNQHYNKLTRMSGYFVQRE